MKKQMMFMMIIILVLTLSFSGCGGESSEVELESFDEEAQLTGAMEEMVPDELAEDKEEPPTVEEQAPEETADQALHGQGSLEALMESDPAIAYLEMSMEEIESTYGSPSMEDYWRGSYFLSYDQEDLIFFIDFPENDKIFGVGFLNYQEPGQHHLLGLDRGITFGEIRERLGEPDSEGLDENSEVGGYQFNYSTEKHNLGIYGVDDTPGVVGYVEIMTNYEWR